MDDLLRRSGGNRDRANAKAAFYVLLYILTKSVAECSSDQDDWRDMQGIVRRALEGMNTLGEDGDLNPFDAVRIEGDVERICGGALELGPFTNKKREEIVSRLRGAYETHLKTSIPGVSYSPEVLARSQAASLASAVAQVGTKEDALTPAVAELQAAYGFDGTSVATFYTLLFITKRMRDEPGLAEACDYFHDYAVQELAARC